MIVKHPIPNFSALWKRHEEIYVGIFSKALSRLSVNDLVMTEDAISERLSLLLNTCCFQEGKTRNCEIRSPDWETPIPPVIRTELKGGKVRKRPD